MKRKKLLFAMLCIASALGMRAQSDVTSTYITNPSFESDGAITASNGALTITGWTQSDPTSSYNNTGCYDASTNLPTQGTVTVTPSDGDYLLFFRKGWAQNAYTFTTSEAKDLPAGSYTLSVDYKMVEGYDNTQNNNTKVIISAKNGETVLGTAEGTTKTNVSGGGAYTYLNTADWNTVTANFTLENETSTTFVIALKAGGQRRSDFVVDNVRLFYTAFVDPTAITLDNTSLSMIPTAKKTLSVSSYTPAGANHNKAITWTSSDGGVATVSSEGQVTAVAPGTATITATTANSISTTCEVTVNKAPVAEGDYYILNVSKGKYLGTLKDGWGTQAAIAEHGIPFTATLANGAYTLDSHTYNSSSQHFLNGTYVDGNSTNLYITSLGSGKYSISTSEDSGFLTANTGDAVVANSAADASSELAQWKFVTKAELESALASATSGSPVDATFYIGDPDFSRNLIVQLIQNGQSTQNPGSETYPWSYNTVTNYHFKGGNNSNMCAETYRNNGGTITQTLTVLNGKYLVKCQGFYRVDEGSDKSYLTANDEKAELNIFNANDEGTAASMSGASTSFSKGLYQNELEVDVIDGTLTIGIQNAGGNWCCFDNFELYYYGPNIAGKSTEITLDAETEMTAGMWYYFDIPVDGLYNLTTTTLSNIVYTTDGTILIEDESDVTDKFSKAENEELTAGRYFVKSSSAQNLKVTVGAYSYAVGSPTFSTVDGGYTQSSTFTVTFTSATNDPSGETALVASSKATVNGNEVDLSAVTNGFSLNLGELTANADYVISIPAGVYGYDGQSMNAAIDITIHTPVAFDGEYCLYDAANSLFLGRGCQYGTEASVDKYGIPFNLKTDATGVSSIEFVDWPGVYLFITDGAIYTDNASTGWKLVPTTGGYYLRNSALTVFATHSSGTNGEHVYTTATEGEATVWTLKTKSERDAIIAAYPADNKKNVIDAAGISTTAGEFETFLSNNYNAVDCTSAIGTATFAGSIGDWTWNETARKQDGQPAYGTNYAEVWCATGAFTQTIDKANLPAGIYKVTVQGFERRKSNDAATALYDAGYNLVSTYLSANGEQVRFTDWNVVTDKPNNVDDAVTAFGNGEATNEVYVYLDGNTDLELTVRKPNYIWDCWIIMNNFTLTRYESTESVEVTSVGYATYASDHALDFTDSGIQAYIAKTKGDGTGVTFTQIKKVPAGTGVLLYKDGGATVDIPIFDGTGAADVTGNVFVRGTGANVDTDGGTNYNYILNDGGSGIGFYRANGKKVATNRAYISIPKSESAGVKEFISLPGFEDDADGISLTPALSEGEEAIYNVAGQRMSKIQKGINIVNGKKILK